MADIPVVCLVETIKQRKSIRKSPEKVTSRSIRYRMSTIVQTRASSLAKAQNRSETHPPALPSESSKDQTVLSDAKEKKRRKQKEREGCKGEGKT